jgi:hypothetical protein
VRRGQQHARRAVSTATAICTRAAVLADAVNMDSRAAMCRASGDYPLVDRAWNSTGPSAATRLSNHSCICSPFPAQHPTLTDGTQENIDTARMIA